jgi:glycine/D-amino acid oxidase-like deaminating enzyme
MPCRRSTAPRSRSATTVSRCAGTRAASRTAAPDEVAAILALAVTRLRDFERYRLSAARTCFYDVTRDQRFLVERCESAWVLAGFSGHGFKFAAVIGERIAAALAGERSAEDLAAWAAGRL